MPRQVRDVNLETRTARMRLKARGRPYWRAIEQGAHLGYRRLTGGAGRWIARLYLGEEKYTTEVIAPADDFSDGDGVAILNFSQAQGAVRERMVRAAYAAAGKHYGAYSVADAVAEYLDWMAAHRKSVADARSRVDAFILPKLGSIDAEKLTAKDISKWIDALAKLPPRVRTAAGKPQQHRTIDFNDIETNRKRRSSANRSFTVLRAALNKAVQDGKIKNVAWRAARPFRATEAARLRFLTLEECRRLINSAEPLSFRNLVRAALLTGARYGEIGRLRVHDFDHRAGTIQIATSKSGKPRHVHMTQEGVQFFEQLCAGRPGGDLMLVKETGEPWRTSNQEYVMRDAVERAKISPAISFHGLRHSYASLAIMGGAPLFVVAKNLGHANTLMVEKHYGHLAESYVKSAIRDAVPTFGLAPGNVKPLRAKR